MSRAEVRRALEGVKPNVVDRVVGYFDPVRAARRYRARMAMAISGAWTAGRKDRRSMSEWQVSSGSADADNLFDLPTARQRSRDLVRNNPLATGAINTAVTSIAGTGLALKVRPDAEMLGLSPEVAKAWATGVQRQFRAWAENPVACDASRTDDFYGLQALALRSAFESGDVFGLLPMVDTPASAWRLKVHLIEADRVTNRDRKADTDRLAGGVEMDQYGAPVNYHILKTHPGAFRPTLGEWDVIPAFGQRTGRRNVIHLFDKRRPGQSRGFPYLAPVIESLRGLGRYTDAEIDAAVVSSFLTVFIKTEAGGGLDVGDTSSVTGSNAGDDVKLAPAAMIDLRPGEDISTVTPGRPNSAFDPFVLAVMRQIGAALEIPYELLIKHFAASYSASRAALLEAWRFFRARRAWLAARFCQPIYEAWFEEGVALDLIDAPGFFDVPALRAAYLGTEWIGDAPGQIDELKEVSAAVMRIEADLSNHEIETMRMQGLEWGDTHAGLTREREQQRQDGTAPQPAPAMGRDAGGNPDEEDDDEDERALLRATAVWLRSRSSAAGA